MVSRATRSDRIAYARQALLSDPSINKRGLQSSLKAEFGVGLSDTIRRELLHWANTPGALRGRTNTRAFRRSERKIFNRFLRLGNPPYIRDAINHRWELYRRARAEGWTRREYWRAVRKEAIERGWIVKKSTKSPRKPEGRWKGQIDIYAMIKEFRDEAIDEGEYIPLPSPLPRTDKGDIKKQKERYRERQEAKVRTQTVENKRSQTQNWIRQLDIRIEQTTSEVRKAQLNKQKDNLQKVLRELR